MPATPSYVRFDLRDHGIAVRQGLCMSMCVQPHPRDGRDRIYLGFNAASSAYLVVELDPQSGRCVQYDAEAGCQGPWDMQATGDGRLLVTGVDGSISELNPAKRTLRVVARAKTWFWNISRASDGKYYLGSHPDSKLYRFDLATRKLESLGEIDRGNKYIRLVEADEHGFVYMSTGVMPAGLFVYDTATQRSTRLLAGSRSSPGFARLGRGVDGALYARIHDERIYRLDRGKAVRIASAAFPGFGQSRLADGTTVSLVDPDSVKLTKGRRSRLLPLKYQGGGAGIWHLARGPQDTVYAGTILPLYLLRYTPATDRLENLGRGGPDNGEIYSFGHVDGKLYYATYAGARLMVYDPKKPIRTGLTETRGPWGRSSTVIRPWNGNPKHLTDLGKGHCRTQAMHIDSRKRVWVGSEAEYGKRHGGLACYDIRAAKLRNAPVVIRDQGISCLTSSSDARTIYGGSTIERGSGLNPVAKQAYVFAWHAAGKRLAWKIAPVPGAAAINNLHWHKGMLYGTSTRAFAFFVIDTLKRKVTHVYPSPWLGVRPESICLGPDGAFYGITWNTLFRWQPGQAPQAVMKCSSKASKDFDGGSLFHRGAVIIGDRYYFSCGPSVMSVQLDLK